MFIYTLQDIVAILFFSVFALGFLFCCLVKLFERFRK